MDIKKIKQIVSMFEQSKLSEMDIEFEELKLSLKKPMGESVQHVVVDHVPTQVLEVKQEGTWIVAPLVGTYYEAASPDSKPFVHVDQVVTKGDVVCVIEAMKVMNEVKSTISGVVKKIAISNQEMVEFNQQLICIEAYD